jgi:hypothetical protein
MHTYNEIMNAELNSTLIAELAGKGARPVILKVAGFCVFGVAAYSLIVFNLFR